VGAIGRKDEAPTLISEAAFFNALTSYARGLSVACGGWSPWLPAALVVVIAVPVVVAVPPVGFLGDHAHDEPLAETPADDVFHHANDPALGHADLIADLGPGGPSVVHTVPPRAS
jgi:hypothetical protein